MRDPVLRLAVIETSPRTDDPLSWTEPGEPESASELRTEPGRPTARGRSGPATLELADRSREIEVGAPPPRILLRPRARPLAASPVDDEFDWLDSSALEPVDPGVADEDDARRLQWSDLLLRASTVGVGLSWLVNT